MTRRDWGRGGGCPPGRREPTSNAWGPGAQHQDGGLRCCCLLFCADLVCKFTKTLHSAGRVHPSKSGVLGKAAETGCYLRKSPATGHQLLTVTLPFPRPEDSGRVGGTCHWASGGECCPYPVGGARPAGPLPRRPPP